MSSSFDPKAAEQELRKQMVEQHDRGAVEVLVALCALWAQASTLERIDYLIDKNGDGLKLNFADSLRETQARVDRLGRREAFCVTKEECYSALRPIVRYLTSFVSEGLLSDDNRPLFEMHPSGYFAPSVKVLEMIMPLVAYAWKRRDVLSKIKWEDKSNEAPATEDEVGRAVVVCRANIDMVASDTFMDKVRNHSIALQMPTWTLSLPSTRDFKVMRDYYQAMRESSPMELNVAYRNSSTPPLLVFKEGQEVTAQREVMLMLMLCGKNIGLIDERRGDSVRLPVAQDTLIFSAGQYTYATSATRQLSWGFGPGERGLVGALVKMLYRADKKTFEYIKGDSESFREKSGEADFSETKCW